MKSVVFAAILIIGLTPSAGAASNPDGVAVIIGNKTYGERIPAVDYAHNDAQAGQVTAVETATSSSSTPATSASAPSSMKRSRGTARPRA